MGRMLGRTSTYIHHIRQKGEVIEEDVAETNSFRTFSYDDYNCLIDNVYLNLAGLEDFVQTEISIL